MSNCKESLFTSRAGWQHYSAAVFSFIFPDNCRVCEKPLTEVSRVPVCRPCLSDPRPLESEYFCLTCQTPFVHSYPLDESGRCAACRSGEAGFDAAYTYGSYEGTLRTLIHLFKYGRIESLAKPLARFLVSAIPHNERFDVVIPLPLHWTRRWGRGFNQADLLAKPIAKRYGVPLQRLVKRVRATKTQASLSQAQRRANLKGAFQITKPSLVAGKKILLIDDVFTTGATLRACAGALKQAGASRVTVLTLARVDRRDSSIFNLTHSPKTSVSTANFSFHQQTRST